jgi:diguanylate cyclase (GGDEF)-like protein
MLLDRLDLAIAQARRDAKHVAVLFLDIDAFKNINDTLGHSAGDEVLKAAAQRLQVHLRKGDTLARVGGDEFTAVVRGFVHPADTAKVAQSFQAALKEPVLADQRELFLTACTGISVFPDDGDDVETLLKNADTALHRAKEQGHDTFRLYTASMNAEAVRRLRLEHSLRRALSRDEMTVHYQPIVDLGTGRVHGVEALIRWNHPEHGLVLPGEFIPLAERTGLLGSLGPWVLRAACRQAREWRDAGLSELNMAVNISARQLQYTDLVGEVTGALQAAGLDPRRLELEITESSAMRNPEATIQTLRALKALGVRISIDDFGTGYSSLSQLQRLPIDTLKIDRSFVRDITEDPDDAAIATAIIALAHTLKLRVVAEGVETKEQLAFLTERRCDRIQGYLVGRPLAADACATLLRAHEPEKWRTPPA